MDAAQVLACRECGGTWTRPAQRGRKPQTCPDCRASEASSVGVKRRTSAELSELDNAIVRAVELEAPVTLRGVFYRVSSAGAVEKSETGYAAVGRRLLSLRRSGRVAYSNITDGTRYVTKPRTYRDAEQAVDMLSASYRRELWQDQAVGVQVMTEKDAIRGVIEPVTSRWDVPLGIVRGYASETFAYEVADSINRDTGDHVYIYQLGDHDPSGVDAWRSFTERVSGFLIYPERASFERLAVTPAQIAEYKLPTRPTKRNDTRAKEWAGDSVEVDAIPAPTLRALLDDAITQHVDQTALEIHRMVESQERAGLRALSLAG